MSKDKAANSRQPVRSASSTAGESGVLDDGISGSAMAVPPPKVATSAVRPDNAVKTVKGRPRKSLLVSKSDTSNCNMKQAKDVIDRSQELIDALVLLCGLFLIEYCYYFTLLGPLICGIFLRYIVHGTEDV